MGKQSRQEQKLLEMLNSTGNRNKCGECKATYPTWASWNLGIFLCGRCASAHRSLGKDVSRVKSLSMDNWTSHELKNLERIGNKENNQFWNNKHVPFPFDPDDKDTLTQWLRDKYRGKFKTGGVRESDYHLGRSDWDDGDDVTDAYGMDRPKMKKGFGSYGSGGSVGGSGSGGVTRSMRRTADMYDGGRRNDDFDDYDTYDSVKRDKPRQDDRRKEKRLTFRRASTQERKKYGDMSRKMKFDLGYEDEDLNIEALSLSRGNIDQAIVLIKQQAPSSERKSNSPKYEAPSLPKRKSTSGALLDPTKVDSNFDWLGDSGNAANNTGNTSSGSGNTNNGNQVYQYMDPNTGTIYYIDSNGQQYVDPNQAQQAYMDPMQLQQAQLQMQQQMMMQQQQMMTGMMPQQTMVQPGLTGSLPSSSSSIPIASSGRAPTLDELQQQQLQQQQMQQLQLQQQQLQQQQLQQQQTMYGTQQPNYFTGF